LSKPLSVNATSVCYFWL